VARDWRPPRGWNSIAVIPSTATTLGVAVTIKSFLTEPMVVGNGPRRRGHMKGSMSMPIHDEARILLVSLGHSFADALAVSGEPS